jgi:hypothetical protein
MKKIIMDKIQIRPKITSIVNDEMKPDEIFQNNTIRPVVKLQHEIIFMRLNKTLSKSDFTNLSESQKKMFIQTTLFKNIALRNEIIGMISGCFTNDEYDFYLLNYSSINKRIIKIIIERIISTLKI